MSTSPAAVVERLHKAMNEHELEDFLAFFDSEYRSEQPVHPDRTFVGIDQVRKNWSTLFAAIPDFHAELLRSTTDGEAAWSEWIWTGTHTDGRRVHLRGVTIFGVREGRITWGRLYMEPVNTTAEGIDAAVARMAGSSRVGE